MQTVRCYNDVWAFDTEGLRWRQAPVTGEWPDPRAGHSATLVGTDIFFYGGTNSKETFTDVYRFDIVKNHWTRAVPIVIGNVAYQGPGRRTNHAAALDKKGRIYIFGGYSSDGQFLNDLWVLSVSEPSPKAWKARDLLRVTWEKPFTTGKFPEARESHTMTIVDRKLAVFGGYAASGKVLNDLHIFDLDASDWSQPEVACPLPPPRQGHTAARHGHELVIAGGCDLVDEHPVCQSDVWSLDLKWMRWTLQSTDQLTWLPREGHSAVFMRGSMFTFGGCLLGAECYSDVVALNTFTPCPSDCGGHGECVRACDGNGSCNQDLFCRCLDTGFSGHDCLQPESCLTDCGPHGMCGSDGVCECENGWSGDGCAQESCCPGTPAKCSGRGVCLANGTCQCSAGFGGPDCASSTALLQFQCPSGCCGHGDCMGATCQCAAGWYGPSCAMDETQWHGLQDTWLALRERLLREAHAKREQAAKSRQLAEAIARASQQRPRAAWARPEAQAQVAELLRDSQALKAGAAAAEARAAADISELMPSLSTTTCDGGGFAATAAAAAPAVAAPVRAMVAATTAKALRLRASRGRSGGGGGSLAALDGVASPQDDFGFGRGSTIGEAGCHDGCNYQGICEYGVCFCRPGYFGEACASFNESPVEGASSMGLEQAVVVMTVTTFVAVCAVLTCSKPKSVEDAFSS